MSKRFSAWAGRYKLKDHFFKNIDTIWPIVDNKNCGEIQGEPRSDQFFCIAFDFITQGIICNTLNNNIEHIEEYEKILNDIEEEE